LDFRGRLSNVCKDNYGDVSVFQYGGDVCHLGFVMRVLRPPANSIFGFYRYAKFAWNRYSSFNNMQVFLYFASLA